MTNKLYILLLALATLVSCNTVGQRQNSVSIADLSQEAQAVLTDKASTWGDVTKAVNPLIEEITKAATDEKDIDRRMEGQEYGYKTIKLAINKYLDLMSEGRDVSSDELDVIIDKLQDAINVWFYDDSSGSPNIWRDHFYVSYQSSDNPIGDYLHIMVSLPTKDKPEPSLHIFYPDSAEGRPAIIFKENRDDQISDDDDLITFDNWTVKNDYKEGIPMHAYAGGAVVQKMLSNSTMYLLFNNGNYQDRESGETEIARVSLEPFHNIWNSQYR